MQNHEQKEKVKKSEKPRFYGQHALHSLGSFSHMAVCRGSSKYTGKMSLKLVFNKKITTGSYGVRIGCAWCSWKACGIYSLLVQKKKVGKKKIFTQAAQTAID
jgi:hypothetical protein